MYLLYYKITRATQFRENDLMEKLSTARQYWPLKKKKMNK